MNQISTSQVSNASVDADNDSVDIASYLNLVIDSRWLISAIALAVTIVGAGYSIISTPVYQTNILVQVEDAGNSPNMLLGGLADAFQMKSAATAEIEILRSRFVLSRAVNNTHLNLAVEPKRFPLIGSWLGRRNDGVSNPGLMGFGGYVWGTEQAQVSNFDVPAILEGKQFVMTVTNQGYTLTQEDSQITADGKVGEPLTIPTPAGTVKILIAQLNARPGAVFYIQRNELLREVEKLQRTLVIGEKGKQSGVIGVTLEGTDRVKLATVLNEIGNEYVLQNIERKSEEAEKSLAFLEKQLPEMKNSLNKAEAEYNAFRNSRGTVDLNEEAKTALQQSVISQTRLIELKQKRDELLTRYQPQNPLVSSIEQQMRTLNNEIAAVNARIKTMPAIEQDVIRLTRDIKVNTDLYASLLNSAQQLRLLKASKVGTVRMLDHAVVPLEPVRPRHIIILVISLMTGLVLGIISAFVRKSLFGGIEDPLEIERILGLTISAAIPHSAKQDSLYLQVGAHAKKVSVLAHDDPNDLAIESMRSLRTSLQFSMLGSKNNVVMITGPTPGVGKSFVSINFAAVLASTGKRVLLIDADLRKGYLHRYLGLDRERGLSELIADQRSLADTIHPSVVENVDFISTGAYPPRPSELLEHPNFKSFLAEVSANYDLIVIDTAPILAVTDAAIVASHAGVIFNVVRGSVNTIGEIEEADKRLRQTGHKTVGVVFNDLKPRVGGYGVGSKYGKYRYAQYKY